jgi:hypothetical protein
MIVLPCIEIATQLLPCTYIWRYPIIPAPLVHFSSLSPPCVNDMKDQTQHVIDYVDGIGENSLQSGGMEYGSKANGSMWSSFDFFKSKNKNVTVVFKS